MSLLFAAGDGEFSPTGYVTHHLEHLKVGEGIWTLHADTLFFSIVLGLFMVFVFWLAARKATAGVPGRLQNFSITQSRMPFTARAVLSHRWR